MPDKPVVVGIGEILFDLLPEGARPGGAVGNFAAHAAAQGCEGIIVSAVGTDDYGKQLIQFFHGRSVNTDYIQKRRQWPTGTVHVSLDNGIPSYTIESPAAWDHIRCEKALASLAKRTDAVTWGTLGQREDESARTIIDFVTATPPRTIRFFDVNLRQSFYSEKTIYRSLSAASHFKLGDEELPVLAKMMQRPDEVSAFANSLFADFANLHALLYTMGKKGSIYFMRDGKIIQTPICECGPTVDTVGCGDSFSGTFVSALCLGAPAEKGLRHAAKVAGLVAASNGALPQIPPEYTIKHIQ